MSVERLESKEKTLLRHPPIVIVAALLGVFFIIISNIVIFSAKSPNVSDNDMATIVIISQALYFIFVLVVLWLFNNIVRITSERIIKYKVLPWRENEEISLQVIEGFYRSGWTLFVAGGGRQIKFFCPPFFAPRIISTLREYVGPGFDK